MITSDDNQSEQLKNFSTFSARIGKEQRSQINNFLKNSKIRSHNFETIGSNKIGGLSNFWGGAFFYDHDYINKNKINFDTESLEKYFKIEKSSANELSDLFTSNNSFLDKDFDLVFSTQIKNTGSDDLYSASVDFKKLKEIKSVKIVQNKLVTKIIKKKDGTFNIFVDDSKKVFLNTEKVVLAAGVINSTRLLLDYFNLYDKRFRIFHNPSLAFIGLLKSSLKVKSKSVKSHLIFKQTDGAKVYAAGSIGFLSDDIIDTIARKFRYVPYMFVSVVLRFLKKRLFVANCFFDNSFSDSSFKLMHDNFFIAGGYSKKYLENESILKKRVRNFFSRHCYLVFFKRMPIGSDIHYTGTLTSSNHHLFKLRNDYSLKSEPNIFVIDGSVIKGNPFFPGVYIIMNSINFANSLFSKLNLKK